jgi:hypothetical protein
MKYFIIVLIGLFLVACGKKDSVNSIDSIVSTAPKQSVKKTDDRWITASFYSSETKSKWTVTFSAFVYDNAPNGYVIIKDFTVGDKTYTVNRASDPLTYIETIHTSLIVGDDSIQGNKQLRDYFRTAESVASAYFDTGVKNLDESVVVEYGKKMIGREYGIPAKVKLR